MTREELVELLREEDISEEQVALVDDIFGEDGFSEFVDGFVEDFTEENLAALTAEAKEEHEQFRRSFVEKNFTSVYENHPHTADERVEVFNESIECVEDDPNWVMILNAATPENMKFAALALALLRDFRNNCSELEIKTSLILCLKLTQFILERIDHFDSANFGDCVLLTSFFLPQVFSFDDYEDNYLEFSEDSSERTELTRMLNRAKRIEHRTRHLDEYDTKFETLEAKNERLERVAKCNSTTIKRITIAYMIEHGHIIPHESEKSCQGNWKWWALIQVWAKANKSLGIPDIGYDYGNDGMVSPMRLTASDRSWINREFGLVYTDKDDATIKTKLARNPEWKNCYLGMDEGDELAILCDEIDAYLDKLT